MLDQKIAQEVIDCALSTGGDFAEIFYEDRLNNGVMMRSGKVESINSGRLHGAGVRVYLGLRGVYVYTNDTTREGLLACARRAASALHADSRVTAQPLRATEYVNCHPIAILPSQVKTARKIEKMRAAQGVLSQYDEVVQGMIRYTDSEQRVWIANSDGLYTSDTRVYTRMSISAIASNGTENQTGTSNPGALQGFEIFDSRIDPEAAAHKAAKQAITMLHAPVCPAGIMPVVIDNGFGGVIFHEACGHSLEATSVAVGASEFAGKLGQKIAADCVTAIDDGTMPNEWGSENIDDEGTPTTRLVLIENGVLKNYMIDRLNGRRMRCSPPAARAVRIIPSRPLPACAIPTLLLAMTITMKSSQPWATACTPNPWAAARSIPPRASSISPSARVIWSRAARSSIPCAARP